MWGIQKLRRLEEWMDIANSAADLVIYDLLMNFPPSNEARAAAIAKIIGQYGAAFPSHISPGALVDAVICREYDRLREVAAYKHRHPVKKKKRVI